MAPSHLQAEVEALAASFGAEVNTTVGDELLDLECGAIHAVGRAAPTIRRDSMDLDLGQSRSSENHHRRQGCYLRQRRFKHETRRRVCAG